MLRTYVINGYNLGQNVRDSLINFPSIRAILLLSSQNRKSNTPLNPLLKVVLI